ncbi:hypothetical protein [Streptomyces sp. NPDC053431]|uniref:hypothetical protein n=1 Tax=Streptomyces sp. NPDC053431 TaxID=3365703 RepID=UPI0037D85D7F
MRKHLVIAAAAAAAALGAAFAPLASAGPPNVPLTHPTLETFARVNPNGHVAMSSGMTGVSVTRPPQGAIFHEGVYCFDGFTFTPDGANVTLDNMSGANPTDTNRLPVAVVGLGNSGGCPAGTDLTVMLDDPLTSAPVRDFGFFISVYDIVV